jgi:predicted N-acetyltransferase YhbS
MEGAVDEAYPNDFFSLHERPDLVPPTLDLIQSEWPGSEKQRRKSMDASCDGLPCHMVLVRNNAVVGHILLKKGLGSSSAGLVALALSVVVDKSCRGLRLGSALMMHAEDHARRNNCHHIYLWTTTAEGFYKTLGYTPCAPVTALKPSATKLSSDQLEALENLFAKKCKDINPPELACDAASVWMRKRLIDTQPMCRLSRQEVEDSVRTKLADYRGSDESVDKHAKCIFSCLDIPWQQQVGPSCGLAALRMVHAYYKAQTETASDSAGPLTAESNALSASATASEPPPTGVGCTLRCPVLEMAVERGYSCEGEIFDATQLALLAADALGMYSFVVQPWETDVLLMLVRRGVPVLVPYDNGEEHNPSLAQGQRAHWGVLHGYAQWVSKIEAEVKEQSEAVYGGGEDDHNSSTKDHQLRGWATRCSAEQAIRSVEEQQTDKLVFAGDVGPLFILQHSLSRAQVVVPCTLLEASNAQLEDHAAERPNEVNWAIPVAGQLRDRVVVAVPADKRHLLPDQLQHQDEQQ